MTRPEAIVGCERLHALVDAYLDGELGRADESAARAHVHDCAGCARLVEHAIAVRGLLRSAEAIRPSPRVRSAVAARIRAEQAHRERHGRWLRVLVPALAPAVAAALAFALWNPARRPPMPPAPTSVVEAIATDAPAMPPRAAEVAAVPREQSPVEPTVAPPDRPDGSRQSWPTRRGDSLRTRPSATVVASAPGHRDGGPTYLTPRLSQGAVPAPAAPVVMAEVPEPDAVFVANAETRYSL